MFVFETHPDKIQTSLASSMQFLYRDSDKWRGWRHCIPYCNDILSLIGY